jgi:hypothetical protein
MGQPRLPKFTVKQFGVSAGHAHEFNDISDTNRERWICQIVEGQAGCRSVIVGRLQSELILGANLASKLRVQLIQSVYKTLEIEDAPIPDHLNLSSRFRIPIIIH